MRLRSIIRTAAAMFGPARPIILYHQPTARCDCRCVFCKSWLHQPGEDDVLPSERIVSLLDQAHAAGMTMYTVWGGEPLLAVHLPEWLRHACDLGMRTVVCTSGRMLEERADEIGPHTERLLLSLEAVGEKHDKIRGTPGLFERVVAGLHEFRKQSKGEVVLWCNLSRENNDQVEEIARFSSAEGVHVEFFPATKHMTHNDIIILDHVEQDEVFGRVMNLKIHGYPVINTWYALKFMRTAGPFRCNLPRLSVQVCADGNIYACDPRILPNLSPYGSIDTFDLTRLSSCEAYRHSWQDLHSCNRCLLPCVAHAANSLPHQAVRKIISQVYYAIS